MQLLRKAMNTLLLAPGYTRDDLIRHYRLESLKHHPDKNNNTPESTARFQEINEAYCTLLTLADNDADDGGGDTTAQHVYPSSYSNIFTFFIRAKFNNNSSIEAALMDIIANNYNKLLANLDKQTAVQIYEFMQEYADILYLRPEDMERMRSIVADKMKSDNLVILNPSLKDLIEHRVYRLEYEGQVFMVPLWHHEMYYPLTGIGGVGDDTKDDSELIVRCILEDAPDYVHVDDLNNLTIHIRTSIQRAFDAGSITVSVIPDIFEFTIPASALSVARVQTYTHSYRGEAAAIGIPQINSKHMYDASALGRVDVCIELY
jgi:hypothetical protein